LTCGATILIERALDSIAVGGAGEKIARALS
jgi:hypothetical protein